MPQLHQQQRHVIAIDWGTCNTCITTIIGGEKPDGYCATQLFPSSISYIRTLDGLVPQLSPDRGEDAITLCQIKRLVGLSAQECLDQNLCQTIPALVNSATEPVRFKIFDEEVGLSSVLLSYFKLVHEFICRLLNIGPNSRIDVVLTSPVAFTIGKRALIQTILGQAGFDLIANLAEPTAAALSHLFQSARTLTQWIGKNILVLDFGGGTFDITVLEVTGEKAFKVLGTSGHGQMGGDSVTTCIQQHCLEKWAIQAKNLTAEQNSALLPDCEFAKKRLCKHSSAKIRYPSTGSSQDAITLTKDALYGIESFCRLVVSMSGLVKTMLVDAHVPTENIDRVAFVGGGSLLVGLKDFILGEVGLNKERVAVELNAGNVVAKGACMYADSLVNGSASVWNLTLEQTLTRSIGIYIKPSTKEPQRDTSVILKRGSSLPTAENFLFFTTSEDNQKSVIISVCEGEHLQYS
ncbi:UNVERIFIED_CONTAM: hypothetical protein HDU68_002812 [Siphonaria sp. JEL0065]|nr:hypothetical protein HDU68_002812 [Siphonaria sp. JEL0065]